MGGDALRATTGKEGITNWYGYPLDGVGACAGRQIMPCLHPALVLRKPVWREEFERTIQRFTSLVQGAYPRWTNKTVVLGKDRITALYDMAARAKLGKPRTVDLETFDLDAMFGDILNIGVADDMYSVSVPWPPSVAEHAALVEILSSPAPEVYHNAQHDLTSMLNKAPELTLNGVTEDTLLMHAAI